MPDYEIDFIYALLSQGLFSLLLREDYNMLKIYRNNKISIPKSSSNKKRMQQKLRERKGNKTMKNMEKWNQVRLKGPLQHSSVFMHLWKVCKDRARLGGANGTAEVRLWERSHSLVPTSWAAATVDGTWKRRQDLNSINSSRISLNHETMLIDDT